MAPVVPKRKYQSWVTVGFLSLIVLLFLRLVNTDISKAISIVEIFPILLSAIPEITSVPLIDVLYFPCFIASLVSSVYVWMIFTNLFGRLTPRPLGTNLLVIFAWLMILLGTLIAPHAWLVFASISGLSVSYSFWGLYKSSSNVKRSNVLRHAARSTAAYTSLGLILGCVLSFYFYFDFLDPARFGKWFVIWEFGVCSLFVYFLVECIGNQSTQESSTRLLLAWDRLRLVNNVANDSS